MKKPNILKWVGTILLISGLMSIIGQNILFNILRNQNLLTNVNASSITILYSLIAVISLMSGILILKGNSIGEKVYLLSMPIAIGVEIFMVGFTPMVMSNSMACILVYLLLNTQDVKDFFKENRLEKEEMKESKIIEAPYKLLGVFLYGISLFILTGGIILGFLAIANLGDFRYLEIALVLIGVVLNIFSLKLWKINFKFMIGVSFIVVGSLFLINAVTFSLLERIVSEQILLMKYILSGLIGIGQLFLGKSLVLKSRK
jgi:hypothetical protein